VVAEHIAAALASSAANGENDSHVLAFLTVCGLAAFAGFGGNAARRSSFPTFAAFALVTLALTYAYGLIALPGLLQALWFAGAWAPAAAPS
jgi:hypothetical protein